MSKTSSRIEIATTVSQLLRDISDIPVLSPLKPLGNILVTIGERAAMVEGNKETVIMLAARVDRAVRVLINQTRDLTAAFQSIQTYASRDAGTLPSSEVQSSMIDVTALRVHDELDANDNYSVQVGTYRNQAVVVKKYYTSKETLFVRDLKQRIDQIHPGIACVLSSSEKAKIILLCAEGDYKILPQLTSLTQSESDLLFCKKDMADIESIRRPWQERRIGPPIPSTDGHGPETCSTSAIPQSARRAPNNDEMLSTPSGILTVKESDVLLQQFISVVKFLKRMDVEVAWWQFKPSWAALRQNKHIVLIDWREDFESGADSDFDPRYAIHLMGLGFSDIVPDAFQDLGRLLAGEAIAGGRVITQ
ncbi:hypothetical protein FRC00_014240 [Tulasnella sp. 408]|nr:hypothetical protein FRC00_014240 [Tulasnella sp. 408]